MPPGRKPKPPGEAVNQNKKAYPWMHAAGVGWQHGDPDDRRRRLPAPPPGLLPESKRAWELWMTAWWASFWAPADLPLLRLAIIQYDGVRRGEVDVAKLLPLLDRLGLTPKGRQDLRWQPPKDASSEASAPAAVDDLASRREARLRKLS